jgi:beta-N-acetylhexosaminidase
MRALEVLTLLCLTFAVVESAYDWTPVNNIFNNAILNKAFPGAVVMVGNASTTIFQNAYGSLTYRGDMYEQLVRNDTVYDVGSLTKVMGTTSAILSLYESKFINLEDKVTKYYPIYKNGGKENTTISNLLLHSAGLL